MSHNSDMIKLVHLLESKQEFAGERVGQKPGDQVRGTDKAEVGGKDHPFKGRLVGEDTTLEDKLAKKYQDFKELQAKEKAEKKKEEIEEVKQRLDPKCWDGYKKQGTKMKGGVRVNNCVPESTKQGVAEDSLEEVSLDLAKRARDKAEYYVDMDYDDMRDHPEGYSEKQRSKFQRYIDKKEPRAKGDRDWDPPNKGVAEGSDDNPVASAIYRRLMNQKPDLFTRYGLEVVAQAVEDVADSVGHLGPDDEIGSSDVSGWVRQVEQQLRNMGEGVAEAANPTDKITVDVPLMLRIMEYAREDAQDDMDLHDVTEKLVELSAGGKTLSMSDYDTIVGMTAEQKLSELGATPPAGTANPAATATTANAAPTTGSVSPDEQTALNKIQTNPTMKAQLDKLMTQAKPAQTGQPMKLNPDQEDALEKIKANAGLKTQYDKIIQQANPQAKV